MSALIRAELLSLRTLRSTYVIVGALLALTAGITIADLSEIGKPTMDTAGELREPMVASSGIVAAVFAAVMAAVRIGGEYRYETIGQRLLASPVRQRLLAARVATYAAVGALASGAVLAMCAAISVPMLDAEHLSLGLSSAESARLAGEVMLSGALLSVLGVAVGLLTRSQTAAVLTLGGIFLGERLVSGLLGDLGAWLPTSLMDSLLENHGAALEPAPAAIGLTALAGAATVAAGVALRRRDVT